MARRVVPLIRAGPSPQHLWREDTAISVQVYHKSTCCAHGDCGRHCRDCRRGRGGCCRYGPSQYRAARLKRRFKALLPELSRSNELHRAAVARCGAMMSPDPLDLETMRALVAEGSFEKLDALEILDHCRAAWNRLLDQPWKIMSPGLRNWASIGQGL